MEFIDALHQVVQQGVQALAPTELAVGTVTETDPLAVSIDPAMDALRAPVLYLTAAVVEKKIPVLLHTHDAVGLNHTHSNSGGTTTQALSGAYETTGALADIACVEHGETLPVEDGYIILNRALAVGDKVLLLEVMHGQRFVVLSRVFEGGGG